jgi:alkylhydroperoxidase/carboxymuconolactone decarboxylase family protein YurZ
MPTDLVNLPSIQLRKVNEQAGIHYRSMRDAIMQSGPLDANTCELILIGCFAARGCERSFRVHALRGLKAGMSKETLEQVVMIPMGAASPLAEVTKALTWLDEVAAEHAAGA